MKDKMSPLDLNSYIKKCKRYLWFYRIYILRFLSSVFLLSYIPSTNKIKQYTIIIATILGIFGIVSKFYIESSILKCPFCGTPFSRGSKYLHDVPYKCKNCDRIIDKNAFTTTTIGNSDSSC